LKEKLEEKKYNYGNGEASERIKIPWYGSSIIIQYR